MSTGKVTRASLLEKCLPCGRNRKPAASRVTLTIPCGSLARSLFSNAVMLSVSSFSTAPSGTQSVAPMRLTLAESVGVTGSVICGSSRDETVVTIGVVGDTTVSLATISVCDFVYGSD